MNKDTVINVAITNLGKYNEGQLLFRWIALPATDETISQALTEIEIDGVRYEEYFISDYESPFPIGEYESLSKLNEIAALLEAVKIPVLSRFGAYDVEDVLNFAYESESLGLINDATDYVGDIIDNETLDSMVKDSLDGDYGWLRIRYFLQDADPNADYHRMDGYGNVDRVSNDYLKSIVSDVMDEIEVNL